MQDKLPIIKIMQSALKLASNKTISLIRLSWLFITLFIWTNISTYFHLESDIIVNIIYTILIMASSILALVACHRVFLLDSEALNNTHSFKWGHRETLFAVNILSILIIASIVAFPLSALVSFVAFRHAFELNSISLGLAEIIIYLPMYYFISRWSLILPACSIDRDQKFIWSWHLSSGNSFRLFVLVGIIPLSTSFLLNYVFVSPDESLLLDIIYSLVWLFVAAVEVALLSLSYVWLMKNHSVTDNIEGN